MYEVDSLIREKEIISSNWKTTFNNIKQSFDSTSLMDYVLRIKVQNVLDKIEPESTQASKSTSTGKTG